MTVKRFYFLPAVAPLTLLAAFVLPVSANAQDVQVVPQALGTPAPALSAQVQALSAQATTGQNTQALLDRLDRLERDIRTLNQQIAGMPTQAPSAAAPAPTPVAQAPASQIEYTEGEGMLSRVMVRLDALESEVRTATGQSESLSFGIEQLTKRFDKLMVDLDYRLARLEGDTPGSFASQPAISAPPSPGSVSKVGAMPPVGQGTEGSTSDQGTMLKNGLYQPGAQGGGVLGTLSKSKLDAIELEAGKKEGPADGATATDVAAVSTPDASAMAPSVTTPAAAPITAPVASVLPEGSVQDRYRFAFDLTRQARYEEAEIAFKAFVAAHGDAPLANNARYWLAETFYVRKRYMDAAQAFFEAYKKAPTGPKAPDSLLKLGMSMAGLEKPTEACTTFGKLRKEFTPLKANIEQALNRETKRLSCK